MKELINFHMHSTGSDGQLKPEEVVKEAIAKGLHYICFTDHFYRPSELNKCWDTSRFHSQDYVAEIRRLQKAYADKIDISFGAEFDWLPNHVDWIKNEVKKQKYDYVMGSVHFIFKGKKDSHFLFSRGEVLKWKKVAEDFGGIKEFVTAYYQHMRAMIESEIFDSIGHFDVIKIHNKPEFFSEKEEWYKKEVIQILDLLKKSKMAIEINTSGITRDVEAYYPSLWILKEAKKRNIPITIGTDAHNREQISKELLNAYEFARQAGYKEIVRFKDRKMIKVVLF
jgi:histidinol-phosphatase (PHP family)